MFNFHMSNQEAEGLVVFLQWISRIDTNGWPPEPSRPIARPALPAPTPMHLSLSPEAQQGEKLISKLGCIACHSVGGGPEIGPDLAGAAAKYDQRTLELWPQDAEQVYRERGRKPMNPGYPSMPVLQVGQENGQAIASYLASFSAAKGKED
jgi:cytochrome c551/c552